MVSFQNWVQFMPLFCLKLFNHIWFEIRDTILTLTHSIIGGRPSLLISSTTVISYSLTGLLASCFVFNRLCTPHLQPRWASTLIIHVTHSIPVTVLINIGFPVRATLDIPHECETLPQLLLLSSHLDYFFLLYHVLLFNTFHICIFNWNLCIVLSFPLWPSQHQECQIPCICTEWMNSWINEWRTVNYDFFFLPSIALDWSNKYINLYMLTFMFISPTVRINHLCGIWSFYNIYMRKFLFSQIDYKMHDIRRRNKCILSPKPIQRWRDSWLHHWMESLARA